MTVFGVIADQFVNTLVEGCQISNIFSRYAVCLDESLCYHVFSVSDEPSLPQNIFIGCRLQCHLTRAENNDI